MTNLTWYSKTLAFSITVFFFHIEEAENIGIYIYDFPYFLTLQKKIYCVKMSKIVNLSEGRRFFYLTVRAIVI